MSYKEVRVSPCPGSSCPTMKLPLSYREIQLVLPPCSKKRLLLSQLEDLFSYKWFSLSYLEVVLLPTRDFPCPTLRLSLPYLEVVFVLPATEAAHV